jgi:uncharacterized protein YgiM (DUF1202 family)
VIKSFFICLKNAVPNLKTWSILNLTFSRSFSLPFYPLTETIPMATPNLYLRSRFAAKLLLPAALGMTLLASCGLLSKPSAKAPAKGSDAATTAAGEFKFPQATCGEEASTPSENWYPVYIDGAELSAIRSQYCGNAISEVRSNTGAPTVQVASFTSYEKAKKFATAVGGEVGVAGSASANSAPASSSASATSGSQGLAAGRTATLNSAEKGSPINIRQSASTDASVQDVAFSGDSIKVSSKTEGTDGFTWYKVELDSGATGWVRSDLISAGDTASTRTATRAATRPSEDAATTATRTDTRTDTRTEGGTAASATRPSSTSSSSTSSSSTDSSTIAAAPSPSTTSSSSTVTEAPSTTRPASTASSSSGSSSGRTATIATRDPDSPINVRSAAGTSSEVQDVAYGGDRIQITDTQQGDDGQTWYKVEFESGASGWVRSDFVGN